MAELSPKKKVLFAITKSNFGGAQRHVFDMARRLSKEGGVEVVVAHGGSGILAEKLRAAGVRTISIPHMDRDVSILRDITSFKMLYRIIKAERPDIVDLNSSKMGLFGALACRIARVPRIIFTAHGWPFNEDRSYISRAVLRMLAYLTVMLSHRTLAVSQAVAHDLIPYLRTKVTVVQNGVEPVPYRTKDDARASLVPSYAANEFWFGIIAELHPVKGLSYAIQAFEEHAERHPSTRLVLIGEGDEREKLEHYIQRSAVKDRIHLVGFRDTAAELLPAFDVFVLPSLSEALSYAILDAGAAHVPVIASRVGGIPEVITDGVTGVLVLPRDRGALRSAFERLQSDPTQRAKLSTALAHEITQRFSLDSMYAKTLAAYGL